MCGCKKIPRLWCSWNRIVPGFEVEADARQELSFRNSWRSKPSKSGVLLSRPQKDRGSFDHGVCRTNQLLSHPANPKLTQATAKRPAKRNPSSVCYNVRNSHERSSCRLSDSNDHTDAHSLGNLFFFTHHIFLNSVHLAIRYTNDTRATKSNLSLSILRCDNTTPTTPAILTPDIELHIARDTKAHTMLFKSALSALWLSTSAWGSIQKDEDNVKSIGLRTHTLVQVRICPNGLCDCEKKA